MPEELLFNERLARGWDETHSLWREPLWPRLCKHLHAVEDTASHYSCTDHSEPEFVLVYKRTPGADGHEAKTIALLDHGEHMSPGEAHE